jgi:uncharacterized membrane protein
MTDVNQPTPPNMPTNAPSRGLKIALAVSVAINLAVAGLVGGMAIHGGPGPRGDGFVRDMGFGPFDGALSPEDRENLRKTIQGRSGDIGTARQQMQADALAILSAMKAAPFDPAVLSAALDAQAANLGERLKFGSAIMRDYLLALPDDARRAFADRLEQRMRRGRDNDGGDGKEKGSD